MSTTDPTFFVNTAQTLLSPKATPPAPKPYPRPLDEKSIALVPCPKCRKRWMAKSMVIDIRVQAPGGGDEYEIVIRCPQGCVRHMSFASPELEAEVLRIRTLEGAARKKAFDAHRAKFEALQERMVNVKFFSRPPGPPSLAPQAKPKEKPHA